MTEKRKEYSDILASQLVAEQVNRMGTATAETFAGLDRLKQVANQYLKCDPFLTQGRLFEVIEVTKFNKEAAKMGESLRAFTTDSLGDPHAAADIIIKENGHVLREIQAKSSNSATRLARMVSNPKYEEMDRLVNVEKAEKVKELVSKRADSPSIYADDYKQAEPHITGKLQHGHISTKGTTYDETMKATTDTKEYVLRGKMKEFTSNAFPVMMNAALAGAVIGGGSSLIQQAFFSEEEVDKKKVGKAATQGAVRSAVIAGVGYGVKFIGSNATFLKGNAATVLATSAVQCTEYTYQLLKGKMSLEEYLEKVGENAVSSFSGILLTAAGGVLFGPIGAAVAGTVALIGMKQLYQSFIRAREDLDLTIEQQKQAEIMSQLLIEQIKQEERLVVSFYQEQAKEVEQLTNLVQLAIEDEAKVEETLHQLMTKLNVKIKYQTRESFDAFMMSDEPLRL